MKMGTRLSALLLALVMTLALAACGGTPSGGTPSGSSTPGGGASGGSAPAGERTVYRTLYESEISTLNYLYTGNTNDLMMSANMVDCLVEYDSYGVMIPSLAESWEANADMSAWTFHIRPGVLWLTADGEEYAEVTAQDWVDAAKWVLDARNDANMQYMYDGIVKNASEYYEQTAAIYEAELAVQAGEAANVEDYYAENDINPADFIDFSEVGVKAVGPYVLEYTTDGPCPFFPSVLSYSAYMPVHGPFLEAMGDAFGLDNYGILYNGAFIMTEFEPQHQRILEKNEKYWDAGNVHIERMEWLYSASASVTATEFFLRGEVDYALISADILSAWLEDPAKRDLVSPNRVSNNYSYFYAFNFEPRFDAAYEPDNWTIAVNNENFRQSLKAGLDRVNALLITDPYNPTAMMTNTITPVNFAVGGGMDFTEYPAIKAITDRDSFDATAALAYKEAAVAELTAAGATFPIKVLMPYNPATTNWDKECQVIEQQMETLLGKDYIDIIVEAGPSTGFLAEVRRSGKYAFMKCNWGADYADPQTWTDPFNMTSTYNFIQTNPDRVVSGAPSVNKTAETQAVVAEYNKKIAAAKGEATDIAARYAAFAEAEAMLINRAFVVPFHISNEGYQATRLNVFEAQYAPYGLALQRFKHQHIYETPMNIETFNALYADWETERAAAIAAVQ